MDVPGFTIGMPGADHVSVGVLGRELPHASDYWDGNWLVTPIDLHAGRFSAVLPADLRAPEIHSFRVELESIHSTLSGEAVLASLDGWINLTVAVVSRGRLDVKGLAMDSGGSGNELSFTISDLDQSHLPALIADLAEVERLFPVLGSPHE